MVSTLGALLLLEHRVRHGRWWDDKTVCHGKLGASLLLAGFIGREIEKYVYRKRTGWREVNVFEDSNFLAKQIEAKRKVSRE